MCFNLIFDNKIIIETSNYFTRVKIINFFCIFLKTAVTKIEKKKHSTV